MNTETNVGLKFRDAMLVMRTSRRTKLGANSYGTASQNQILYVCIATNMYIQRQIHPHCIC
jgi:hypothetical protein